MCLQVNAVDTLGQTALHRAAMAGHLQTCRLLLGYGADASLLSLQGFTAAQMGNEAVQQILNGTPIPFVCGWVWLLCCLVAMQLLVLGLTGIVLKGQYLYLETEGAVWWGERLSEQSHLCSARGNHTLHYCSNSKCNVCLNIPYQIL